MPCGCQKVSATGPTPHTYTNAKGETTVYPSAVQAKAAQIRAGGAGTVKPR